MRDDQRLAALHARDPETWTYEDCEAILRDALKRMPRETGPRATSPWVVLACVGLGVVAGIGWRARRRRR